MSLKRIIETDSGIQGELDVKIYDSFLKGMRDRGWLETNQVILSGINKGKWGYPLDWGYHYM